MAQQTQTNLPSELKDREIRKNTEIRDELIGFNQWLDKKKKNKTRSDYLIYTAGYYQYAYEEHSRITPIDLSDGNIALDDIKHEMTEYIREHSKAVEYGLKSYLDYIQEEKGSEEARQAMFLRDQISGVGDQTKERTKEDKIGEKVRSRNTVDTVIEKAPEYSRTLDADEFQLFLRLMYDTAGRVRDILKLQWRDVDRDGFKNQSIDEDQIFISAERSKSKNSGIVNLRNRTLELLNAYRDQTNVDTDPTAQVFFQDRDRGPWPTDDDKRYYDRILSAMQTAAHRYSGLGKTEIGTHDFRHSRLVHLGAKMLDDSHSYPEVRERLQKYGRHDDQETTEIYIGILKNRDTIDLRKYDEE